MAKGQYEPLTTHGAGSGRGQGAENAQSVAQREEVVGWIGPFNSGCAQVQIPILNEVVRWRSPRPTPLSA